MSEEFLDEIKKGNIYRTIKCKKCGKEVYRKIKGFDANGDMIYDKVGYSSVAVVSYSGSLVRRREYDFLCDWCAAVLEKCLVEFDNYAPEAKE